MGDEACNPVIFFQISPVLLFKVFELTLSQLIELINTFPKLSDFPSNSGPAASLVLVVDQTRLWTRRGHEGAIPLMMGAL